MTMLPATPTSLDTGVTGTVVMAIAPARAVSVPLTVMSPPDSEIEPPGCTASVVPASTVIEPFVDGDTTGAVSDLLTNEMFLKLASSSTWLLKTLVA